MAFKKWTAVCPRCSTQNTPDTKPCTNCGKGPVLRQKELTYSYPRYRCESCQKIWSDISCFNCGTMIGGVAKNKSFWA